MNQYKTTYREMKPFLMLWSTQSFSALGSAMTSYALVIWSYTQERSALMTALLMVCSYAPYVIFSIFAGALSDRWNKKVTMLVCDTVAAASTVVMLILMKEQMLKVEHLYLINIINGLMNTVQQPASEVAVTRILPDLLTSAGQGIVYLRTERGIFGLILFLAAINLVASIYDAAFPAMMLSRKGGNETVMGMVNAVIGIATLVGSILASVLPKPKSRVRVICNSLLFAMSFENFMLALGRTPLIWCIGGFLGWIAIPLMNTNLDVILRTRIPLEMQGRVYSVRNSFQFFTIPIGYFLGGFLVDRVFEPMMAAQKKGSFLIRLFGDGKGSGAAALFFVIAFVGIGVCLWFRRDPHIWELEKESISGERITGGRDDD